MKRSLQVTAPLLTAAAIGLLSGCHHAEMQRCVDEQNHVVPDNLCQNPGQRRPMPNGLGFYPMPYRYYYGGGGGYGIGSSVFGGGYTAIGGHSYASSTSRGGFGSSHGGGDSGGGGE